MLASAAIEALNIIEQKPGKNFFSLHLQWFCYLCVLRPWRLKISKDAKYGMGLEGRKEVKRSIDLMIFCMVEKNDFCGCCLKMHVYLSQILCSKYLEGLFFNFSKL